MRTSWTTPERRRRRVPRGETLAGDGLSLRSTLSTALLTAVVTPLSMVPDHGATMAFALISVAPTVVLSLVFQRCSVQGFARSGIR